MENVTQAERESYFEIIEKRRKEALLTFAKSLCKKECKKHNVKTFTTCRIDTSTSEGLIKLAAAAASKI